MNNSLVSKILGRDPDTVHLIWCNRNRKVSSREILYMYSVQKTSLLTPLDSHDVHRTEFVSL